MKDDSADRVMQISLKTFTGKIGTLSYWIFNSGSFYTDGGSAYGILPKAVWSKSTPTDTKNRIELACNLMLFRSEGSNILIDSGIGSIHDERTLKVYKPDQCRLLNHLKQIGITRFYIDKVILTHLHHDHIGGLITGDENDLQPTFPNAKHYVQTAEWTMARNPDELNKAAYNCQTPLTMLENNKLLSIIEGDYDLTKDVRLMLVGGHSVGSQVVRLANSNELLYYPGDIIPQKFHLNPTVTSAYDLSREQTVKAKKLILDDLKLHGGTLVFNHETKENIHRFDR